MSTDSVGKGRSLSLRITIYEGLSPDLYLDLENAPKKLRSEKLRHLAQLGLLVDTGKFRPPDDQSKGVAEPSAHAPHVDASPSHEKAVTSQPSADGGLHSFVSYFP